MKKIILNLFILCLVPGFLMAEMKIGESPERVVLSGKDGGLVKDGSDWDTNTLVDKVHILFYVDPDESDINEKATDAIRDDLVIKQGKKEGKYSTVAVINMDATWLPNGIVKGKIEDKQKEFSSTLYVLDYKEILHKKWGIATDSFDIIIIDKEGKVAFSKDGTLSKDEIQAMLKVIRDNL